jgi:hypothetical protein
VELVVVPAPSRRRWWLERRGEGAGGRLHLVVSLVSLERMVEGARGRTSPLASALVVGETR